MSATDRRTDRHTDTLPYQRPSSAITTFRWLKKSSQRHKHCALTTVRRNQKKLPAADLLHGDAARPKFNKLEMVTTFTYKHSLMWIEALNFELLLLLTQKQTYAASTPACPLYTQDR